MCFWTAWWFQETQGSLTCFRKLLTEPHTGFHYFLKMFFHIFESKITSLYSSAFMTESLPSTGTAASCVFYVNGKINPVSGAMPVWRANVFSEQCCPLSLMHLLKRKDFQKQNLLHSFVCHMQSGGDVQHNWAHWGFIRAHQVSWTCTRFLKTHIFFV